MTTLEAASPPSLLTTGIAGLDHLLRGGLLRGNSLLIEGPPGSGKSTLGLRIVHEGIVRHGEPALVIAFEEFPLQLHREAASAGIDLREHERSGALRVLWTPPSRILDGFRGHDDLIDRLLREMGARRLLIDSITHFRRVAPSEVELREVLSNLLAHVKLRDVSAFLIKELDTTTPRDIAFEEYLVDASLRLYHDPSRASGPGGERLIEVRKTRGQGHVGGRHPFELGRGGVRVHPRLLPQDVDRLLPAARRDGASHRPTGDDELDRLLGGGLPAGRLALVAGPSGSGKTRLARQFLSEGLARDEGAVLVTLADAPGAALTQVGPMAGDWRDAVRRGRLRVIQEDVATTVLEKLEARILRTLGECGPARIVVDGLADFRHACDSARRTLDAVALLARAAAVSGATFLLTTPPARPDDAHLDPARLAEVVISLETTGAGATGRRVRLAKGGRATPLDLRDYEITATGLRVWPQSPPARPRRDASAAAGDDAPADDLADSECVAT